MLKGNLLLYQRIRCSNIVQVKKPIFNDSLFTTSIYGSNHLVISVLYYYPIFHSNTLKKVLGFKDQVKTPTFVLSLTKKLNDLYLIKP